MRNPLLLVALLFVAAVGFAQGITLPVGGPTLTLTDCPLGGTDGGALHNGSLTEGKYLFRVISDDVSVCVAAPDAGAPWCTSGGEKFPQGFGFRWSVPRGGLKVGCRGHAGDAGDVIWSREE